MAEIKIDWAWAPLMNPPQLRIEARHIRDDGVGFGLYVLIEREGDVEHACRTLRDMIEKAAATWLVPQEEFKIGELEHYAKGRRDG